MASLTGRLSSLTQWRSSMLLETLVKMAQRPRTMFGKLAVDFIRAELDAETAARVAIAAKHGVQPSQL